MDGISGRKSAVDNAGRREIEKMKEFDRVVLTVNKAEYMKDGLYMGMCGRIWEDFGGESENVSVNFDLNGWFPDIFHGMCVSKRDLAIEDAAESEERSKCIAAIYFPDLYNTDEYRKDYAVLTEEAEEYGRHDVHLGAYGQILSPVGNDVITVRFDLKYPKKSVTLDIPKKHLDYYGKPDCAW